VAAEAQDELRDAYWAIFYIDELIAAGMTPGPQLVAAVQARIDAFATLAAGRSRPRSSACSPTATLASTTTTRWL